MVPTMSYLVSIRRPAGQQPLTTQDVLARIRADPDLELIDSAESNDELAFVWNGTASVPSLPLHFSGGSIDSMGTPSNAAIRRLQRLARDLDAALYGEAGEEMTESELPEIEVTSIGVWVCTAAMVAVIIALIWWLG